VRSTARGGRRSEGDETRRRIIETAERLFAERGIEAISIRDITGLAGVNGAAIFYHFGSKEGLVEAILQYRANDFAARRAELLDVLETADDVSLRDVIQALVKPTAELASSERGGSHYLAFMAAVRDHPELMPIVERYYDPNIARFLGVLSKVTPHLSDDERIVRFALAKELIHRVYGRMQRDPMRIWVQDHAAGVPDDLAEYLTAFLVAAFGVPGGRPGAAR
jgi:AcrR family transcriptional regulator